jgi:precorrin-2 dehydrogenase/sirohydrochlorin ferrochelatase
MRYYPICLDIRGRYCLVVGGGLVAERKVKGLLAGGAIVTVVSPQITEGLQDLLAQGEISWSERGYQSGELEGVFLVIAATDETQVQEAVYNEAVKKNILVNVADVPEKCSFILPAQVRRGDLCIAVSTAGKSPALAKKLRQSLEKTYGNEYKVLVDLLGEIRPMVLERGLSQQENEAIFNTLLESDVLALIRSEKWELLQALISDLCGCELNVCDKLQALNIAKG